MTAKALRALKPAAITVLSTAFVAAAMSTVFLAAAAAQEREGFFNQFFGGNERGQAAPPMQPAQMSPSELVIRLERLENLVRQLTGQVEQLQYRNQQLEQQLRAAGGAAPPPQAQQAVPPGRAQVQPMQALPAPQPGPPQRRSEAPDPNDSPPPGPRPGQRRAEAPDPGEYQPAAGPPRPMGRRADVFDPNENPNAPGAPRVLGSIPANPTVITGDPDDDRDSAPPVGAPGGRRAGAPLDLSTLSGQAANDPTLAPPGGAPYVAGTLPGPPPRQLSATGAPLQQQAALPPSQTPKDEYDLAYGYVLRKDYALAEETFRGFLRKYPSDRLVAEANYWLGESLFQRQRYRDAAESFLTVSTKFDKSGKAPDSLLRLGQSLAALKEKEAACATFSELGRKFPRASASVKQSVEREQKRVGC
jgi:tol-pal system protein YbgF